MKPSFDTLISAAELQTLRDSHAPCMVFDCSSDLLQPDKGRAMFDELHIAGARYADLNTALSAQHTAGQHSKSASGGRHPLPTREHFAQWLTHVGFTNAMQAVVYDRQGANYCGRLWWMLKWLGHRPVAVLDGGLAAWQAIGGAVEPSIASATGEANATTNATTNSPAPAPQLSPAPTPFVVGEPLVTLVDVATVQQRLGQPEQRIVDARAAARFRGETEPIDPVAGHIPGALNRPFALNLQANGLFKPAATLRAEFAQLLGTQPAHSVVHHCGSGVSAVPNIIAMEIAGLQGSALFAGSWSEWCADPSRPVARG